MSDKTAGTEDPIFKSVFGGDWDKLPPVMRRHYANRPYHDDVVIVEGSMNVESSLAGRLFSPLFRLAGTLVPYEGRHIPATVLFVSDTRSNAFRFDRIFHFPGREPYRFRSTMIPAGGGDIIELMRFGIGWQAHYKWNGKKILLTHKGYALKTGNRLISLPLDRIIGRGSAEETPVDDDTFSMKMEIRHPLWGRVFSYSGTFKIVKDR